MRYRLWDSIQAQAKHHQLMQSNVQSQKRLQPLPVLYLFLTLAAAVTVYSFLTINLLIPFQLVHVYVSVC